MQDVIIQARLILELSREGDFYGKAYILWWHHGNRRQ